MNVQWLYKNIKGSNLINLLELYRQQHNIELRQDIDKLKKELKDIIEEGLKIKGKDNDSKWKKKVKKET